jgi:hypothetical protein
MCFSVALEEVLGPVLSFSWQNCQKVKSHPSASALYIAIEIRTECESIGKHVFRK